MNYNVTETGIVYGKRGLPLQLQMHKGYWHVTINGHTVPVHRLVAKAYVPNPECKPEIHHIDENPLNNNASNLMWVTRKEHQSFHKGEINPRSKLNWDKVDYIRQNIDVSTNDLATELNVTAACISLVKHNKSWKIENHPE